MVAVRDSPSVQESRSNEIDRDGISSSRISIRSLTGLRPAAFASISARRIPSNKSLSIIEKLKLAALLPAAISTDAGRFRSELIVESVMLSVVSEFPLRRTTPFIGPP